MTDVIEIPSDDDDDILNTIDKNVTKTNSSDKEDKDTANIDLSKILNKYCNDSLYNRKYEVSNQYKCKRNEKNSPCSSDDDIRTLPTHKNAMYSNDTDHHSSYKSRDHELQVNGKKAINSDEMEVMDHKSQNNRDKKMEKIIKEQEKLQKNTERERRKQENADAKAAKQAIALAFKNLKPEECMKFITVVVDTELTIDSEYGSEILIALNAAGVTHKTVSYMYPNTISWIRQVHQPQLTTSAGQLGLAAINYDCEEILFILKGSELVDLVQKNRLLINIQQKQLLLSGKKLHIGVYGLGKCLPKRSTDHKKGKLQTQIELGLTELQIMTGSSHRLLETPNDLNAMIMQFTKSIAQAPYKSHKHLQHQQLDWFMPGDNKDSVRVDTSGNGLQSLWRQQLTQFPLARLETADAISAAYPGPLALMRAYDSCISPNSAEMLLQDVSIRRAAGTLTAHRKIGPELSKKVYTVFCSLDGETAV